MLEAAAFFATAALVGLGYFVYSGFKYTRMISNIFLSLVYRPEPSATFAPRGEKFTILDSSDSEIEALLVQRFDSKHVVIFCHESGAGKETWEKYAYFLPDLGYRVLSFDFAYENRAGVDNSLAQWPTALDVDKLVTVIRWAKRAFPGKNRIVLFGVSNGADVALAASQREPAVKAVITDGLFSMKEIFRDYIRKWAPILVRPNFFGEKYPRWILSLFASLGFWYSQKRARTSFVDVESCLSRRHPPLLMIHGEKDDYVPNHHQTFLEKKNRRPLDVRRIVVPKAGHNQAVQLGRGVYEKTVKDFLEVVL